MRNIIEAAKSGDLNETRKIIGEAENMPEDRYSSLFKSNALEIAAQNGRADCLKILAPVFSQNKRKSDDGDTRIRFAIYALALQLSSLSGHPQGTDILAAASELMDKCSIALRESATQGHAECVRILSLVSDISFVL